MRRGPLPHQPVFLACVLSYLLHTSATPQHPHLQPFTWSSPSWQPFRSRRLLTPFPDGPSAVTLISSRTKTGQNTTLGSAGGDTTSAGRTTAAAPAASEETVAMPVVLDPSQAPGALKTASSNSSCPTVTIYMRALQVIHPLVNIPGSEVLVQCQTDSGKMYKWYPIPLDAAYERSYRDAKFSLQLPVALLKCGEAMSCRVGGQWPSPDGRGINDAVLFDWTNAGCWFKYSHFTSNDSSRSSPLWSCRDSFAGEYVLQCAECSGDGWDASSYPQTAPQDAGGGQGPAISPTVIIIATCVCSGTAVIVGVLLLVRHRRRARSMNARIAELLRRAEGRRGDGGPLPGFKPAPLYQLEAGGGEEEEDGQEGAPAPAPQGPPPPGYKGPIVVVNYDGSADLGTSLRRGSVVLATAELSVAAADGDDGAAMRQHGVDGRCHHRHSRRRRRQRLEQQGVPAAAGAGGRADGTPAGAEEGGTSAAGAAEAMPGRPRSSRAVSSRIEALQADAGAAAAAATIGVESWVLTSRRHLSSDGSARQQAAVTAAETWTRAAARQLSAQRSAVPQAQAVQMTGAGAAEQSP